MKRDELSAKIKEVITEVLRVKEENIKGDSKFIEDLGADSLDIISLLLALEDQFGTIPDSAAKNFITVDDVLNYVLKTEKSEQKIL
ncbi:acyl carrier protein [Chitinispirillales bacterium ANBcel5]|uniref:acyl carrier protein n=1 Tax=Cellulosispirillum alkaliphilum TaxID=3039283 RepID=UPI002A53A7CD|nr:acyl carrier protein [Chitinispirillales bacterium ANBcel5]